LDAEYMKTKFTGVKICTRAGNYTK